MKTVAKKIHKLADTVGISYGVCHEILTENLNVHRTRSLFPDSSQMTKIAARKGVP
jgi:hypothetical protein